MMSKRDEEEWDRSTCTYCHPRPTKPVEANGFWSSQCTYKQFCESLYVTLYSSGSGYKNTAQLLTDLYARSKIDGRVVARENNYILFECLLKDKDRFGHVVNFQRIGEEGDPNRPYSFIYSAAYSPEYEQLRRKIRPNKSGHTGLSSFENELIPKALVPAFKQPEQHVKQSRIIHGPLFSYEEDVVPPDTTPEHLKMPAASQGVRRGTTLANRGRPTVTMPLIQNVKKFIG